MSSDVLTWDPPVLSKQGCPNLAGRYHDNPVIPDISRAPSWYGYSDSVFSPLFFRFPGMKYERSTQNHPPGWSKLEAITSIANENGFLVVDVLKGNEKTHNTVILDLSAENVGCLNGALVRRSSTSIGSEGFPNGGLIATEAKFRKLQNGDIEYTRIERSWSVDRPQGPRVTEVRAIYKPVQ
jgi:hypothetical protein